MGQYGSLLVMFAVLAVVLSGCTYQPPPRLAEPLPTGGLDAIRHQEAVDALARWDAASAAYSGLRLYPLGEAFGQMGDWEPANARFREAVLARWLSVDAPLGVPAANGDVRWYDGTTHRLPALSAGEAWDAAGWPVHTPCDGCPIVHVTGAVLGEAVVPTTRGPVAMPVWEYTVDGSAVRLTRPAVALPQPSVV